MTWILALTLAHLVAAVAASVHVLLHYRRPTTAIGWMFAIWALPLLGVLAYLMLAVYEGPRSVRKRRRAGGALRSALKDRDGELPYSGGLRHSRVESLVRARCAFPMSGGNQVRVISDPDVAMDAMLDAIRSASEEVLVQTFILEQGEAQKRLSEALVSRAREGVEVHVLIDPIGSFALRDAVVDELEEAGIELRRFLQPSPLKGRFQVNFRNHRKLLLVDRRIGFTGGRNWEDPYFFDTERQPAFSDLTLEVGGPVVGQMRRVFFEDWVIAAGDVERPSDLPSMEDVHVGDDVEGPRFHARVVTCSPDDPNAAYADLISTMISRAEKRIVIVSPYFAPGSAFLQQIRLAVLGGVKVTILVPEVSDSFVADHAGRYFLRPLSELGADVRLRRHRFIHAKAIIVDDAWATVGSANLDYRSLELNYELNIEIVGREFVEELLAAIDRDFDESVSFPREPPGVGSRLVEGIAALFEPLL